MVEFIVGLFVGGAVGALVPTVATWYKAKFSKVAPAVSAAVAKVEDAAKKL